MKLHRLLAFTAASLLASAPAYATLIGATVTGTLHFGANPLNYFNPANFGVPAGYGNSAPGNHMNVVIGGGTEFGYQDGANRDTANFTATQLIVQDEVFGGGSNNPFVMTFTSSAFGSIALDAQSFIPGLTHSLVGNTITINWAGGPVQQGVTFRGVYNIGTVGAPDAGSTALMLLGALATAAVALRRQKLVR